MVRSQDRKRWILGPDTHQRGDLDVREIMSMSICLVGEGIK